MIISSPKNLSLSLTTNKHWTVPCFPSIQIYFLLNTHFTCSAHLKHPFFFVSQETRLPFIKGNLKTHILRNNYHVQTLNVFSVFILFINCCHRIVKSCLTFCDPMDCNMPGFPGLHYFWGFAQSHICWIGNGIQPSYPWLPPLPPALNPSQHQGLFQWVNSLHQVAKVSEFQLQHQSFQWTPRTDLLQDGLVGSPCS